MAISNLAVQGGKKRINTAHQALDLLRLGGFLMQSHSRQGVHWFIFHRHGGEVTDHVANQLLTRPDIQPSGDGLFGASQTYRLLPTTWQERAARTRRNPHS
jgi:hypothetical protein